MNREEHVFRRPVDRPIFTLQDLDHPASAVLNPGVAELDGEVVLLLRVEDLTGISHIRVARSKNGVDGWKLDEGILLEPDIPAYPLEEWGCEDARVTRISPTEWVIAYTAYSRYGPAVALAKTSDFLTAQRLGVVLSPENKDAAVFPDPFEDTWYMLHRPVSSGREHIWYACSHGDLGHWGQPGVLVPERGGPWWDSHKVGVGAPPFRTDDGWLLIYHGVKQMALGLVYRLGVVLLDLENPRHVLDRSARWIFGPEAHYEMTGLAPNVVYTCGTLQRGDETWMYYGAADTSIGLAIAKTQDIVDFALEYDYVSRVGLEKAMDHGDSG